MNGYLIAHGLYKESIILETAATSKEGIEKIIIDNQFIIPLCDKICSISVNIEDKTATVSYVDFYGDQLVHTIHLTEFEIIN